MSYFDAQGRERPNPQPVELPLHYRERTMDEKMRAMLQAMLSAQAQRNGQETFEEANDFDILDDDIDDALTPYEVQAMRYEAPTGHGEDADHPLASSVEGEAQRPVVPAASSEVPAPSKPES